VKTIEQSAFGFAAGTGGDVLSKRRVIEAVGWRTIAGTAKSGLEQS
jgi:hypothetical protein